MTNRPATFIALALLALGACARPPMPGLEFPSDCALLPPSSGHADTVTVALFDPVQPEYAPWGHNASERLVFAQLYETLVTVDCGGEVHPALAESWSRSRDARRWTFRLRDDARFWDGTRVSADAVLAGWMDALTLETGIDSVTARGRDALTVYFASPRRRVPTVLAAPAFAVTAAGADPRWPLGTGPYEVSGSTRGGVILRPAHHARGPVLLFVDASGTDARDMLGHGVQVMITGDPAVVEYASGQPALSVVALPWETTYVLLSATRARDTSDGAELPSLPAPVCESLARDAVRTDARAGHRAPWWDDVDACPGGTQAVLAAPADAPSSGAQRILYLASDPVARDLATRVVALSTSGPGVSGDAVSLAAAVPGLGDARLSAHAVRGTEMERSLRDGADFAYVVALPRATPLPCHDARDLARRAPWLVGENGDVFGALLPLVETRAHVVAADCGIDLVVDAFGAVHIVDARASGK